MNSGPMDFPIMCSSASESTSSVASSPRIFERSSSEGTTTSGVYSDEPGSLYALSPSVEPITTDAYYKKTENIFTTSTPESQISNYNLAKADLSENEVRCEELRQRITEYEVRNFMQAYQSPEFLDFSAEHLQRLVEHDSLNVSSESDVFWAIKRWYKQDVQVREKYLPHLIGCLRLTQFDIDFLYTNINTLPGCEILVNKAVEWILRPIARSSINLRYTKTRKMLRAEDETFWIAVQTRGDRRFADKCVLRYNKSQNEWQKWDEIKLERSNFGIVQLENSIICIGGLGRNNKPSNRVNRYNLSTQVWEPMPSMEQRRVYLSVALLNGRIYAFGGQDEKYQALNTVEMFDTISGRWQSVASMTVRRAGAGVASLDGKLYVVGGFNRTHLSAVECYDPVKNIWTQCMDLNEARGWCGVTVYKDHLYAIGGWFNGALRTVERFSLVDRKWTMISPLNIARGSICGIAINGELWAVGGYSEGMLKDTVEVYDGENDKWVERKMLPEAGRYVC